MKLRKGRAQRWEICAMRKGGEYESWNSFKTKAEAMKSWQGTYYTTKDGGRFVLLRVDYVLIKKSGER
jgi:hypothetical protein